MATNVAKIQAELDLDSGKFHGTITSAIGQLKTFNTAVSNTDKSLKNIERRVVGLGASLRDTMVVLGQFRAAMHTLWMFSGQWVSQIIEANAKLERLQQLMKGLSKASTEAEKVTESLRDMNYVLEQAKNAPFAVDTIADAFVKLKASGIDPTTGSLQALTDAVAHFGGSSEQLHRATIAIQQMSGKGVISMEELRQQLGEAVPNAMQLMARATGMSMGELVKTISTGRLEAKSALEKLFLEMKYEFGGSAQEMMGTWTGMVQKLKTEWLIFAKEIGDQGLFDQAKRSLQDLLNFMSSDQGKLFARDIGYALGEAVKMAAQLAKWLVDNRDELITWGKLLAQIFVVSKIVQFGGALISTAAQMVTWTRTLGGMTTAMAAARAGTITWSAALAAAAGPIGIAITAIGSLVAVLYSQAKAAEGAARAMQDYYDRTARGEAVTRTEFLEMDAKIHRLRQIRELVKSAQNVNPMDGKTRNAVDKKMNEAMSDLRDMGFLLDGGNGLNDFFTKGWNDKITLLNQAYDAGMEMHVAHVRQASLQAGERVKDATQEYGKRLSAATERAAGDVSNKLNDISMRLNAGTISKEAAQAERQSVLGRAINAKIQVIEASRKELERQGLAQMMDEKAVANIASLMKVNNEQLQEAYREREALNSDVTLLPKMGFGGDGKPQVDQFMNLFQQLTGKIAELRGKLSGEEDVIPKLERFKAMMGGMKGSRGLADDIERLYGTLDELEEKVKKNKATEQIKNDLTEMEAKARADVISASIQASGDVYNQVAAGMVGFNRQVEVLRANLDKSDMSREDFEAWVVKIKAHISEVDFINFKKFAEDTNWENYLASLPQRTRNLEEFNKRLAEFQILRDQMKANSDPSKHQEIDDKVDSMIESETKRFHYENRSEWEKWIDDYTDITEEMDSMWANTMNSMADTLTEALTTGKASFKDFATSVLKEITRILTSQAIAKLAGVLVNMFAGGFGGGGTGSSGGFGNNMDNFQAVNGGGYSGYSGFANGGIMTDMGPVPLRKYAKGGIADRPQLAMYAEGDVPEAFVPLPDGRSIPVTMDGGSGGTQNNVSISVVINQDGTASSKTEAASGGRELGAALDMRIRQVLGDEMRPGGIIWRMNNGG